MGDTLTRGGNVCDNLSQTRKENREEAPPVFLAFPSPVSQLRRWIVSGSIRWGYTPPCATSIPLYPIDGEGGFRPAPCTRVRPPALHAATKGNTGAAAAPVFLWTLFPHQETRLRGSCVLSAQAVLNDSTRPLAMTTTCVTSRAGDGLRLRHRRRLKNIFVVSCTIATMAMKPWIAEPFMTQWTTKGLGSRHQASRKELHQHTVPQTSSRIMAMFSIVELNVTSRYL